MSKEQQQLWDAIKKFYPMRIVPNYRPDRLKNDKTGNNFEVDLFLYDHFVGVEYQGMIHFKEIKKYGNNSDSSRYNDVLKAELNSKKGRFAIIEVFPQDLKGDIKENFIKRLLITQEVYFNNLDFKKCKSLEMVYMHIIGVKNKPNIKLFDKIHDIHRCTEFTWFKLQNLNNLKQYMNDVNIKFHDAGRPYFNFDYITEILGVNDPAVLRKARLKIRYQNLPIPEGRDKTGEIIQRILTTPKTE